MVQSDTTPNDGGLAHNEPGSVIDEDAVARDFSARMDIDGGGVARDGHGESGHHGRYEGYLALE